LDVLRGASGGAAGSSLTVAVVGTGLIGGSLGLALRAAGYRVRGYDADPARLDRAVERGAVDVAASSLSEAFTGAQVAFVAVPVSGVVPAVEAALDAGVEVVSDVGSVKAPVVQAIEASHPAAWRFVGGHPMAGSADEGIEAAAGDIFDGATWVLTPTATTDPAAFTVVRDLVATTGAEVVAVEPGIHDELVATVSHLPHLAASALMHVAADAQPNHETLLRLAAGGFRALTRLSGRSAGIWPDICVENRAAIVDILDRYVKELERVRDLVSASERAPLLEFFEAARAEGSSLPSRSTGAGPLVELSMPVPDRPGVLAEVTTLAGRHGVNIVDLDISHGPTGGVLLMVVPAAGADAILAGLDGLGYHTTRREVG
jgi:prephenate dehydrogenase